MCFSRSFQSGVRDDASRGTAQVYHFPALSRHTGHRPPKGILIKPLGCGFLVSGLLSQVMLIERLPHENLDDRLPTDVEIARRNIQFMEHILCKVHIHSLYRRHHSTCVGKVAGDVLTTLGPFSNRFGRDRLPGLRSLLHKVFVPPWLPSRALSSGGTRPRLLLRPRNSPNTGRPSPT